MPNSIVWHLLYFGIKIELNKKNNKLDNLLPIILKYEKDIDFNIVHCALCIVY